MDLQQLIDLFFLQSKICNLLSQKKYEQNLKHQSEPPHWAQNKHFLQKVRDASC